MGIWDFISSGAETVKRNTPDLATQVKKVCKSSYNYSAAAVRKIDDLVRGNDLQKLGQNIYMPDEEGRAKIVNFSTKFVKNASVYAVKEAANIFIPGGRAVSQIYSQTVREMEIESKTNQNTSCNKEITGNLSKDTTIGIGSSSPGLFDNAEKSKRIDNSSKDTTTGTSSLQWFNGAEMPESIDNSSKDTTTGTGSPKLFNGAEMPESVGNSSKDTATGTGSPKLFNGAEMPESVGNSSQDTTTTSGSLELLDGAKILGRKELQFGAAQLSLLFKAKL